MKHLHVYESFLSEGINLGGSIEDLNFEEMEMVYGTIDILKRVRDLENRQEIAEHLIAQFRREGIHFDYSEFLKLCGLYKKRGTTSIPASF